MCCCRCRGGAVTGGAIPAGSGSAGEPTELPKPFCPPVSDNTADTPKPTANRGLGRPYCVGLKCVLATEYFGAGPHAACWAEP